MKMKLFYGFDLQQKNAPKHHDSSGVAGFVDCFATTDNYSLNSARRSHDAVDSNHVDRFAASLWITPLDENSFLDD